MVDIRTRGTQDASRRPDHDDSSLWIIEKMPEGRLGPQGAARPPSGPVPLRILLSGWGRRTLWMRDFWPVVEWQDTDLWIRGLRPQIRPGRRVGLCNAWCGPRGNQGEAPFGPDLGCFARLWGRRKRRGDSRMTLPAMNQRFSLGALADGVDDERVVARDRRIATFCQVRLGQRDQVLADTVRILVRDRRGLIVSALAERVGLGRRA